MLSFLKAIASSFEVPIADEKIPQPSKQVDKGPEIEDYQANYIIRFRCISLHKVSQHLTFSAGLFH